MMRFVLRLRLWVAAAVLLVPFRFADAQTNAPEGHLDPTRDVAAEPQHHDLLPEEYLWTAGDITAQRPDHNKYAWNRQDLRIDPHFFRTKFVIAEKPQSATVYVAGVRSAKVWINGDLEIGRASCRERV